LLAANIYQGNPDRNHKLWSIVSTERCMLHMQVLFSNIWVLKRANVIFYERDMDEDVNMPFHLKEMAVGSK
jgi:hypothetical protein